MGTSSWAGVAPVFGAATLVVGTGTAVGINASKRREIRKENRRQAASQSLSCESGDGLGGGAFDGNNGISVTPHQEPDIATKTANDRNHAPPSALSDPPLRLPTVSAATSIFGSSTYLIFLCTAIIHAICLILTTIFQRDLALSSDEVDVDDKPYAETMGNLLLAGGCVAGAAIMLTALAPAKGSCTIPHISFGFVFIETAIIWMVWTCMWTPLIGGTTAILAGRAVLAALADICRTQHN